MYSRRRSSRHAPSNDAERRIAEMWAKYLGQAEFGIDDDFLDAGGDSLQAVDMMLGVEASFGRQIPRSALSSSLTIRRLAEAVAAHPAGDQELVLRGNAKRGGTPFFFCHGDLVGGGLYALRLAKAMEPCVPVFLVHPCRDFGRDVTLTYEGMARSYVPEILALCPEGRFRLGGFCNGGLLAWEIARQLRMAGREVDVVVMVDSLSQNGSSLFRMAGHGLALFGCAIRQRGMFALWRLAKRCDMRLFRLGTESPGATENAVQPTGYDPADLPWVRSVPVIAGYVPPALDIRLVCLLSEEAERRKENAPEAWRGICSELAVEVIPGDHGTCKTVHLEELARTLLRHVADEGAGSRLHEPARSRNGSPRAIQ
jgi:thioesterase domain-containing protein/acyl carrier protein